MLWDDFQNLVLHDSSIGHGDLARAELLDLFIVVRDQDDEFPAGVSEEQTQHLLRAFLVERGGNLIPEDDWRILEQGAGNGKLLLLSTG